MDDRGQMLLLSALAVCVCLLLLALCLASVRGTGTPEKTMPGADVLDNIDWAQDAGLKQLAGETGVSDCDNASGLAQAFEARADGLEKEISASLLARGIAFEFELNDTLAARRTDDSKGSMEHVGGVLLEKENGTVHVCGCACDVRITDASATYRQSRTIEWGQGYKR